jgi:hypothetical protein
MIDLALVLIFIEQHIPDGPFTATKQAEVILTAFEAEQPDLLRAWQADLVRQQIKLITQGHLADRHRAARQATRAAEFEALVEEAVRTGEVPRMKLTADDIKPRGKSLSQEIIDEAMSRGWKPTTCE